MDLRETYNRIAEDWHRGHQSDDWWKEGTDAFASLLKPGDLVLDAGCGGGTKSAYLLEKGLRVFGIDFSEAMIEIARREVPRAEFAVVDMHDAGTLNQRFDGVFAQASLLHIPRKEFAPVLRALASRLTPDGFLYVAVKGIPDGGPEEEVVEESDYGYLFRRFYSYYSMDELVRHCNDLGLAIVYQSVTRPRRFDWLQII